MGIFSNLFGKKSSVAVQSSAMRNQETHISFITDRLMSIDSIEFMGSYRKSNSGKWLIGWCDSDRSRGIGGHRESGFGSYVLYDAENDVVVSRGASLGRPNGGAVSDDGTFSLEDWHFGNDLSSTLYVFSQDGCVLLERKFTANMFNSGLSRTGLYAVCQTANSRTEDGNKLSFFSVQDNKELFSVHPESGWADSYEFDEANKWLLVDVRGVGTFRYDFEGKFLDLQKYQNANLACEDYGRVIRAAEDILKNPATSTASVQTVLKAIVRARTLGADESESWKPVALKIQGIAHEALGEHTEAIALFEEALKLNPQIGVKRKVDSLKRRLASVDAA